ncbi:MAG: RNA polymerase sigma factor [Acidimicrobiales bacterium]
MDEPDPATMRAATAGDVDAFVRLVRLHQAPVWRFLRHLVGDDALAEDLTQETFLRVHRGLRSFDGRSRFSTWLFRVARNAAIDELRARERRSRLAPDHARHVASPEGGHELRAALDSLDGDLREALLVVEARRVSAVRSSATAGLPQRPRR